MQWITGDNIEKKIEEIYNEFSMARDSSPIGNYVEAISLRFVSKRTKKVVNIKY